MAISFIEALSGSANNGGNVTLTFTSAQSGDFVLVMGGHQESGSNAGVSTSGYTEEADTVTPNRFSISRKFITSDTNVVCLGDGQGSDGTAYVAFVFRGVDTTTPLDASITSGTGTGEPNSPSITTVTAGAVVVSAFLLNDGRGLNSGPTGYNNATVASASEVNNVTAGAAWVLKVAIGAENPSSWDLTGLTSDSVRASTIALRPAVPGAFQDGVGSFTASGEVAFQSAAQTTAPFGMTATVTPSFKGNAITSSPASLTGSGAADWVGTSLSTNPAPFSMRGTGAMSFVGAIDQAGDLGVTGTLTPDFSGGSINNVLLAQTVTWSALFVGGVSHMTSVREVIEPRGAATVGVH